MIDRATHRPIFIVGCQRSGTTLLRLILDSHPNISCGPETRFLDGLAHTIDGEWFRMQHFGFSKELWYDRIAEFFHGIHSEYAKGRGRRRWADKTPRYARYMPFIDGLFPNCQFIHSIRDGRDVVRSHQDLGGYWDGLGSVEKWRRTVTTARKFGATLPADRYTEVRYEELVGDPEGEVKRLLEYLGEPWDPAVLEYDRAEHGVGDRYAQRTASRRAQAGEDSVIYRNRTGGKRLDPLLRLLFHIRSGALLRELGYR